jgi:HNH endonuclease
MNRYIPDYLRKLVANRALHRCEYCHIHEEDLFFVYQIDHIISLKHEGLTEANNLAYACSMCNQNKGTDLGTYITGSKRLVRLFNPRKDKWIEHFEVQDGEIIAKTRIAIATIKVLDLNNIDRVILRQGLISIGRYP